MANELPQRRPSATGTRSSARGGTDSFIARRNSATSSALGSEARQGRPPPKNLAGPTPANLLFERRLAHLGQGEGNNKQKVWGIGGTLPGRTRTNSPQPTSNPPSDDGDKSNSTSRWGLRDNQPEEEGARSPMNEREDPFATAHPLASSVSPEEIPVPLTTQPLEPIEEPDPTRPASLQTLHESTTSEPVKGKDFAEEITKMEKRHEDEDRQLDGDETAEWEADAEERQQKHEQEGGQIGGELMETASQWDAAQGDMEDEPPIRNTMGRFRFILREPLAEFLGMMVVVIIGIGADCQTKISQNQAGSFSNMNWSWGFATMSGIYIAGGISGGHLNPALTIYISAQILGAFVGALIVYGNYHRAIEQYDPMKLIFSTDSGNASATLFVTAPNLSVGDTPQAFEEILATGVLTMIVFALGDENNAPPGAGLGAVVIGFVITAIGMSMGWISGYAINGARDIGPRLALWCMGYGTKLWTHNSAWWIVGPFCGTIIGAIAGATLYDACIFTGDGSPLNYSRHELARAAGLPKVHSMVRTAFRVRGPSAEEAANDLSNREAGFATLRKEQQADRPGVWSKEKRDEINVPRRWKLGKEKIQKEKGRRKRKEAARMQEIREGR